MSVVIIHLFLKIMGRRKKHFWIVTKNRNDFEQISRNFRNCSSFSDFECLNGCVRELVAFCEQVKVVKIDFRSVVKRRKSILFQNWIWRLETKNLIGEHRKQEKCFSRPNGISRSKIQSSSTDSTIFKITKNSPSFGPLTVENSRHSASLSLKDTDQASFRTAVTLMEKSNSSLTYATMLTVTTMHTQDSEMNVLASSFSGNDSM